jgi:hypothetical protein
MLLKKLNNISLSEILIVTLLIIILLQRCGGGNPEHPTAPQITIDTVWVHTDSTITTVPQIIKTIPYPVPIDRWSTEYLPDTNYTALVKQYTELAEKFLSSNLYKDSLHIDSLGYVLVKDTISKNMLIGRTFSYDLKYPIIKETKLIPEKKRTQFYLGGYIQGNEVSGLDELGAELLLKDKKDRMFGISAGLTTDGQIMYGVSSFWKIKLHK